MKKNLAAMNPHPLTMWPTRQLDKKPETVERLPNLSIPSWTPWDIYADAFEGE